MEERGGGEEILKCLQHKANGMGECETMIVMVYIIVV